MLELQEQKHQNVSSDKYKLTYGEQLCLNRCFGKFMNVKEIVDKKLEN